MKDRSNFWSSLDTKTAGDAILTGYEGDLSDMPVFDSVIDLCGSGKSVLDFGCGVGRNMKELVKSFDSVTGFDFPNMVKMCTVDGATSDWNNVVSKKYDVILASLVFQHIHPDDLRVYMNDLVKVTNRIVLHSRTWFDFTEENVEKFLSNYGTLVMKEEYNHSTGDHFIATLHVDNN